MIPRKRKEGLPVILPDFLHRCDPEAVQFPVTHWTLLIEAARETEDPRNREALARFCETYWGPLYNFVRRQGKKPEEAEDLTQGFFAHLLKKNAICSADRTKGSFRSFLLRSMKNFIINQIRMDHAQKRHPGDPILSFDAASAETRYVREPVDNRSPESIYERECAWALVEKAIDQLRARYEANGQLDLYEHLKPKLMGDDATLPYRELAERLHSTEESLRSETYRMRKELRRLLVQLLAPAVSSPAEIEAEVKDLFRALSR